MASNACWMRIMGLGFQRGLAVSPCVPRYGDCEEEISSIGAA